MSPFSSFPLGYFKCCPSHQVAVMRDAYVQALSSLKYRTNGKDRCGVLEKSLYLLNDRLVSSHRAALKDIPTIPLPHPVWSPQLQHRKFSAFPSPGAEHRGKATTNARPLLGDNWEGSFHCRARFCSLHNNSPLCVLPLGPPPDLK